MLRTLLILATLGCVASPAARAQDRVVMASWGGGAARMFRSVLVEPFAATGIPATVSEVPDPATTIAASQGRPLYNVIIAAAYSVAALAQKDLIQELTEADIPEIRDIPEKYWLRDAQGRLLGLPVYFLYYGIAYNTDLAKPSDFAHWRDLTAPKWKDKVSMTRPVFLAPYDLTMFAKLNGGDEANIQPGIPMLESMSRSVGAVYTSMASLQQQLSLGEVVAAPFYSGQIQLLRRGGTTNVNMVLPEEGGLNLPYVLAIPRNAAGQAAARRFIRTAVSRDAQVKFSEEGFLPVNPQATLSPAAEKELGMTLEEVMRRTYAPNWFTVAAKLDERIKMITDLIDRTR